MSVTFKSIAKEAGVSWQAVSAVVNNNYKNSRVGAETRKKIEAIVKKYHFVPNATAQSLVKTKTGIQNG